MTPERWQQIADVVDHALELEASQRAAFVDQACLTDPSLRREVDSLLGADSQLLTSFLQSPPMSEGIMAGLCETASGAALGPGQVFAERFRLDRKVGQGGMGQVWLAEQTSPVRRQVALKLIKAGMYDEAVAQRFQSEQQTLAIMDHPAIAKVFDAGTSAQGRPYLVMEYVPGSPITEYCDHKKLGITERLELFIQVCEGVQHAHQKAIIHRDLKPANILVVEVDGQPVPRIIDFGLAKATSPQANEQTLFTRAGHFVGTPGYMSPEQADPNVKDIDTRTDVYSLGVILYVLLAGSLPLDEENGGKLSLDEFLRRLREEEPVRPSARVKRERETSSVTAEARGIEPKQLASQLRGDLDWITMKALEKDRARRYGTPSELASDVRHYLNHEPVAARPASAGYRLRKYVRRHRIAVTALAGLVMVLTAFAVVQGIQLRRITRERDRANRVTDFMTNMFKMSDPNEARGNQVTVREILDKASNDIQQGLAKDPELQVHMMGLMGSVYSELGLDRRAQSLLEQAREIGRRSLGRNNPETIRAENDLAWTLTNLGHYTEAEKVLRETSDVSRRAFGTENRDSLISMDILGWTLDLEGNYAEAEKIDRETLNSRVRLLGTDHPDTLTSMGRLVSVLYHQGRYGESEKIDRQILDARRRTLGPEHPLTLIAANNLASNLHLEGQYADAEKIDRDTFDVRRRVLGAEHPLTLSSMSNLADVLGDDGQYAEAEKIDRECLQIRLRVLGPENPDTLTSMDNLAYVLFHEDRYDEAEDLARRAGNVRRRVLGPEHPETALSTYTLACIALRRGQRNRALVLLQEAVDHGLSPSTALGMEKDPDLKVLLGDSRFAAIVADAKQRAARKRQN